MLSSAAYALLSTTVWRDSVDFGKLFIFPNTDIIDTKQKTHEIMWQASKYLQDNFNNFQTALKTMSKRIVDLAYHSSGMGRTGFGTEEIPAILQQLQTLYRKPSLRYIDAALLRLNDPMDRNQPMEVMIWDIKEVQIFLLSHPEDNMSLPDTALINYANYLNKQNMHILQVNRALECEDSEQSHHLGKIMQPHDCGIREVSIRRQQNDDCPRRLWNGIPYDGRDQPNASLVEIIV